MKILSLWLNKCCRFHSLLCGKNFQIWTCQKICQKKPLAPDLIFTIPLAWVYDTSYLIHSPPELHPQRHVVPRELVLITWVALLLFNSMSYSCHPKIEKKEVSFPLAFSWPITNTKWPICLLLATLLLVLILAPIKVSFPGGSGSKEYACNAGDLGSTMVTHSSILA